MLLNSYISENIERYGTGFKRIKDRFKNYPNLSYQVNSLQDFVQVIISGVNAKENVPLNERQKSIIQDIIKESSIKQIELAQQYNVSERTIKRDLQFLQGQKKYQTNGK